MDRTPRSPRTTNHSHRRRSRSPHYRPHDRHRHERRRSPPPPRPLPLGASPLHKRDFATHEPMFALYLDIQKQIELEDLPESEAKGRWKSFVGKWNRGELAEGWYDPITLRKAQEASSSRALQHATPSPTCPESPSYHDAIRGRGDDASESSSDDDDEGEEEDIGPTLPSDSATSNKLRDPTASRSGPSLPTLEDLELQKEQSTASARASSQSLHHARKQHNKTQASLLLEALPRADPGSRARTLEKRADTRAANHAFAAAKLDAGADVPELAEADVFGGGGGDDQGLDGFRKRKAEQERVRTERELRREAVQRARREEREERGRVYRRKEESVMKGLVEMARKRFG